MGRSLVSLALRLLFLLAAGVPVFSRNTGCPEGPWHNVTVRQGESAILRCAVNNQAKRVAWLNRSSIIYEGKDKWCADPRVLLITNTKSQYSIEIQNVDVYDEGLYTCATPTGNYHRSLHVCLIVQVPPQIFNISPNIAVNEGSSVTLQCLASGRPKPTITWRHYSSKTSRFVGGDEFLEIAGIRRDQSGEYECSAANEVSAPAVRRVRVTVNYPPFICNSKNTRASIGQKGALRCSALAVPLADIQWYKDNTRLSNSLDGIRINGKGHLSILTFFNVSEKDYGNYTCVASNHLGNSNASVILYDKPTHPYKPGNGVLVKTPPSGEPTTVTAMPNADSNSWIHDDYAAAPTNMSDAAESE